MAIFRKDGVGYEAIRLVGTPEQILVIETWIEAWGLPRLLDPNPEVEPFDRARMENAKGERHTPGFYVDPDRGVLVIRNHARQALDADYGDWIARDTTDNSFTVVKDGPFKQLFEAVT